MEFVKSWVSLVVNVKSFDDIIQIIRLQLLYFQQPLILMDYHVINFLMQQFYFKLCSTGASNGSLRFFAIGTSQSAL